MGTSKNFSAEQQADVRRAVKASQNAHARAKALHEGDEGNHEEFECDFVGRFDKKTEEVLAGVVATAGHVTAGQIYALVQEDLNKVRMNLIGPESAVVALNIKDHLVVARPFAFQSLETIGKKNGEGQWEEVEQTVRTPFRCRSVLVPIGATGFAIKFKYNAMRQCLVVC